MRPERYTAEVLDAHAQQSLNSGQSPLSTQVEARISRAIVDYLAGAGRAAGTP